MSPSPDLYKSGVDFTALALQFPDFAKKLKRNGQLDFSDPESVRQLTYALLHRDFQLKLELPPDRLCPPVPNRFNYILFAQRLLDSTREDYGDGYDESRRIIGLDIGTGASAIYPLLACRSRPSWLFLATEIDTKSREYAQRNIEANNLSSRIKILETDLSSNILIPLKELNRFEKIDILLTNPPFYTSKQELIALAEKKSRPPNSACTGAPVEMIHPSVNEANNITDSGGEVGFVSKLISESLDPKLRTKVQWFSSMLGKLSSAGTIIEKLRDVGCTNYVVNEFVNHKDKGKYNTSTRRWVVAWSWASLRPESDIARGTDAVAKTLLPSATRYETVVDGDAMSVGQKVNEVVTTLEAEGNGLQWRWKEAMNTGVGRSIRGDVWSRAARRRRARKERNSEQLEQDAMDVAGDDESNDEEDAEKEPELAFKISVESAADNPASTKLVLRWLQGQDAKIYESFCGWLKRKLREDS